MAKGKKNGVPKNKHADAANGNGAGAVQLTCNGFKLQFYQNFGYTSFQLQVNGSDGKDYVLATANIPYKAELISKLLQRMADAKGGAGWPFEGQAGSITG